MSTAGGFANAVERALEVDAAALQIFAKSARQWNAKPADPEQVERFRQACETAGLAEHCLTHASYLINLASPDAALLKKSTAALVDELSRAEDLGIPFVVLHPGSHVGAGEEAGLKRVVKSVDRAFTELDKKRATSVCLLLENTAGQGTNLGHQFEHLGCIINESASAARLGVCFDTCHALAAGYDFRDARGYRATFDALEQAVGLARVRAFHLNDSKFELGSRRDRHEHIGEGEVGVEGFRRLLRDARFRGRPMVLETPKGDGAEEDRRNLETLRGLARRTRR
jgi:deoxyribonuclease-4